MDKKLVLWDIDGTLMSCYRDGTLAMNETFRRRTGHENACGEVIVGTSMDSSLVDSIMKRFGIDPEEKEDIIAEFAVILKEIVTANETKKILPGIKEILDDLVQRKEVYMGLITSNFRVGAEIKLDSVGLKEYFKFGGFGDHPGEKWDAAKEAVEEASKLAGEDFTPENIFIIGDSRYDIECAKKIGAKSIGVATGWMIYEELEKTEPDYIFRNFENTEEFLSIICGSCL
ncbi:MAG: HAD family hydrolase [Clostridiales bacterium]|nr:HAD family hydrolase [Clostridiales bacterium]